MASANKPRPLCFIDAEGGAVAVLCAAIARARGRADAIAASTSAARVPAEIAVVLREIGASALEVVPAGKVPRAVERVEIASWDIKVWDGDGDLERLASARIARDRVERRIDALLAGA